MTRFKEFFRQFIQKHWVLLGVCLSSTLILLLWFIPPVYLLKADAISVRVPLSPKNTSVLKFGPGTETWVSLAKLPRYVPRAVIAAEDSRFYDHSGLDYEAIRLSIQYNMQKKRFARGASTLTQQLIKMAFLSRQKSLLRKAREAAGSLLAEKIVSKNEIIEWYLNLAEFGPGVFGIKQASMHYFQKPAENLTFMEAIHLAAILPSPLKWSSGIVNRDLTDFGKKRFMHILRTMKQMGFIAEGQYIEGLSAGNFGRPVARSLATLEEESDLAKENQSFQEEQNQQLLNEEEEWIDSVFKEEAVETPPKPELPPTEQPPSLPATEESLPTL